MQDHVCAKTNNIRIYNCVHIIRYNEEEATALISTLLLYSNKLLLFIFTSPRKKRQFINFIKITWLFETAITTVYSYLLLYLVVRNNYYNNYIIISIISIIILVVCSIIEIIITILSNNNIYYYI